MEHPAGESDDGSLRVDFDGRLKLEFHGSRITSDAGILVHRELDDALGLTDLVGSVLSECRRGKNTRHLLTSLLRQSVFGRLAGYEDVNDPVGRAPHEVRRYYASFSYRAGSWGRARRVVAKVEWHPGELYPRVGFIVTNMTRPAERVVAFYNHRGTAEPYIKEGKNAVTWTRLSCHRFAANAVRLQLHALAYNLANFLRTLALPEGIRQWSMTTLRDRLVKIGAKVVRHSRSVIFQMAEVVVPRALFQEILGAIAALRPLPLARC